MTTTTAPTETEQDQAIAELRTLFPRGARVPVIVEHVARSGMSRDMIVLAAVPDRQRDRDESPVRNVSYLVRKAGVGSRPRRRVHAVTVRGCGMDMTFHLVYTLAHVLYGDGYALTVDYLG